MNSANYEYESYNFRTEAEADKFLALEYDFGWVCDKITVNRTGGHTTGYSGTVDEYGNVDLRPETAPITVSSVDLTIKRDKNLKRYAEICAYENEYFECEKKLNNYKDKIQIESLPKYLVWGLITAFVALMLNIEIVMMIISTIKDANPDVSAATKAGGVIGALILGLFNILPISLLCKYVNKKKEVNFKKEIAQLKETMRKDRTEARIRRDL